MTIWWYSWNSSSFFYTHTIHLPQIHEFVRFSPISYGIVIEFTFLPKMWDDYRPARLHSQGPCRIIPGPDAPKIRRVTERRIKAAQLPSSSVYKIGFSTNSKVGLATRVWDAFHLHRWVQSHCSCLPITQSCPISVWGQDFAPFEKLIYFAHFLLAWIYAVKNWWCTFF